MVFLPGGPAALRSDLRVTLDCLDTGVSLVCPLGQAGQRQPAGHALPHSETGDVSLSCEAGRQA